MTLILHRSKRRCNEEKLRGELLHRNYFSHGCSPRSFPIAKLPGTVGGTFQSIPLRSKVAGNKANYARQTGQYNLCSARFS